MESTQLGSEQTRESKHQEEAGSIAVPSESSMPTEALVKLGSPPLRFIKKGTGRVCVFRPFIFDIVKDHRATLLFSQLDYWFEISAKAGVYRVYKLYEPTPGQWADKGGTWFDEIRLTRKQCRNAFDKIGVRHKSEKAYLQADIEGIAFSRKDGKALPFCSYYVRWPNNVTYYHRNQAWFDQNVSNEFLAGLPPLPTEKAIKARIQHCYEQLTVFKWVPPYNFRNVYREDAVRIFMDAINDMIPHKDDLTDPTALKVYDSARVLYEDLEVWLQEELERDQAEDAKDEDLQTPTSRKEVRLDSGKTRARKLPPELHPELENWPEKWRNLYKREAEELARDDEAGDRGAQRIARRTAEEYVRSLYANIVENQ